MTEVLDAPEDLVLTIQRRDVTAGAPRTPNACPIAQALYRKFGTDAEVSVGASVVLVHPKNGSTVRFVLLGETLRKVQTFDEAKYFEPGPVTLSAPRGVRKLGTHGKPLPKAKKPGSRKGGDWRALNKAKRQPWRHVAHPDKAYTP
jgi:hypothetical protein